MIKQIQAEKDGIIDRLINWSLISIGIIAFFIAIIYSIISRKDKP